MTRLQWNEEFHYYEYGISNVVLYFLPGTAIPWSGVTSSEGAELWSRYTSVPVGEITPVFVSISARGWLDATELSFVAIQQINP